MLNQEDGILDKHHFYESNRWFKIRHCKETRRSRSLRKHCSSDCPHRAFRVNENESLITIESIFSKHRYQSRAFNQTRNNIDYLGPLPNGYYLVVIVDQLSKSPIVEPIRNTSCKLLIDFLQRTISTFGIFKTIVSDNGPPFKSHDLKQFSQKLRTKHQWITLHRRKRLEERTPKLSLFIQTRTALLHKLPTVLLDV